MEPTVGRIVYYKNFGTPNGEFKPSERAAIITAVHDDDFIDVCVFNPQGLLFAQGVARGKGGGQWDWMPFQKGKAAKTEELEKSIQQQSEAPKFNCWTLMEDWINAYEKQVGDGKAKDFWNWIDQQPMTSG